MNANQLIARTGRRVRELRRAARLSLEELAHRAGIDRTYLGAIERGQQNASLRVLHGISSALQVPVARLVDVDDELDEVESARKATAARVRRLELRQLRVLARVLDAIDIE